MTSGDDLTIGLPSRLLGRGLLWCDVIFGLVDDLRLNDVIEPPLLLLVGLDECFERGEPCLSPYVDDVADDVSFIIFGTEELLISAAAAAEDVSFFTKL